MCAVENGDKIYDCRASGIHPTLHTPPSLSAIQSQPVSSQDAVCLTWEGPTLNMAIMANSFRCFHRIWEDYTALWRANYILH